MVDQVEVFFHSQQPYVHVKEEDISRYDSGRLGFPNTYFDPAKAHALYNQYHEQYSFADEAGFDGIMTNEHHSAYWNMKPSAMSESPLAETWSRPPMIPRPMPRRWPYGKPGLIKAIQT